MNTKNKNKLYSLSEFQPDEDSLQKIAYLRVVKKWSTTSIAAKLRIPTNTVESAYKIF